MENKFIFNVHSINTEATICSCQFLAFRRKIYRDLADKQLQIIFPNPLYKTTVSRYDSYIPCRKNTQTEPQLITDYNTEFPRKFEIVCSSAIICNRKIYILMVCYGITMRMFYILLCEWIIFITAQTWFKCPQGLSVKIYPYRLDAVVKSVFLLSVTFHHNHFNRHLWAYCGQHKDFKICWLVFWYQEQINQIYQMSSEM